MTRSKPRRITVAGLSFACLIVLWAQGPAIAQSTGVHTDDELGYRIAVPRDWQQMPLQNDERWIVAKYLSDKDYFDRSESFASGFKPEMRVILFPFAVTKGTKVEKVEEEETEEGKTSTFVIRNPYRDYKEYLDKNYAGGGWFVSLEEEKKDKDLSWTLIEIKVEKLAYGGKKRLVAGVFHHAEADFVVQFEILEQDYDKLKPLVYGALKTFKFIARSGSLSNPTTGGIDLKDEDEMTREEKEAHRKSLQETAFQRAKESLPPGWQAFEHKGFYVLSHVDRKFALDIVNQAAALQQWLEDTFDYVGDDYVRQPIIRICANIDEERAYSDGSGDAWGSSAAEIVTHRDVSAGSTSWEFGWVNRMVAYHWLRDRNRNLYMAMPGWFERGIEAYVEKATLKGARIEFREDQWAREQLRVAAKAGEIQPVSTLLKMSGEDFWSKMHHTDQAGALFRFFLEGPGRSTKNFFRDYLAALDDYVAEEEKARKEREKAAAEAAPKSGPKTEEEEDAEFKNRRNEWREKEEAMLRAVFERAFAKWKESDWQRLDQTWLKWMN